MKHSVLLDTSFFIRLLNDEDPLHKNARDYYKYFLEQEIILKVSTISIAEYCVRGEIGDLPLKNLQILPFNLDHARRTGELAKVVFDNKGALQQANPRTIIPNDSKLFAQADIDKSITHFVTSDGRSLEIQKLLKEKVGVKFDVIYINTPHSEVFGILDFGE